MVFVAKLLTANRRRRDVLELTHLAIQQLEALSVLNQLDVVLQV